MKQPHRPLMEALAVHTVLVLIIIAIMIALDLLFR